MAQKGGVVSTEGSTLLATSIPDATLVAWDRSHWQPWWDEDTADAAFALVRDFVLGDVDGISETSVTAVGSALEDLTSELAAMIPKAKERAKLSRAA